MQLAPSPQSGRCRRRHAVGTSTRLQRRLGTSIHCTVTAQRAPTAGGTACSGSARGVAGVRKMAKRTAEPPSPGARLKPPTGQPTGGGPRGKRDRQRGEGVRHKRVAAELGPDRGERMSVNAHPDRGHDLALEPQIPDTGARHREFG